MLNGRQAPASADLTTRLRHANARADEQSWEPLRFELGELGARAALGELFDGGRVVFVHDTIGEQIAGLLDTRHPEHKLSAAELARLVDEHLAGVAADEYGQWVYYPWSLRLVHVLPEPEFRELRTSRNRNKITADEQASLRGLTMGVVGLSVGQATAVTLLLEEVGGTFRLADFDTLELSNMNRLRAGVHELGLNKCVLTAREMFEINPYARVTLFSDGITESNIDAFLGGLDLLFEECDDLEMKLRLREKAREYRLPMLMETSDRGLIDIERFDREPERPALHGLVGELSAADCAGLSTADKVPVVLRLLGAETMSKRLVASMVDIEASLKSWPQLASAVALGGALTTDAARRIALGSFTNSGRYYVDLEQLVGDQVDGSVTPEQAFEIEVSPLATRVVAPELRGSRGELDDEQLRTLVSYGALAPSGGNCQPWHFTFERDRLLCRHVVERSASLLDYQHSASYLAFGAAAENIDLVAASIGLGVQVEPFPQPDDPTLVCQLRFGADASRSAPFGPELIAQRVTNRKLGERSPLPASARERILAVARQGGARLQLAEGERELAALGELLGEGDRLRFLSKTMHHELMHEIRWSRAEVERTRDGIDVATLELTAADAAGMRVVSSWGLMKVLGQVGGRGLEKPSKKAVAAASAVGLLTVAGNGPRSFFEGGRMMQRVWLAATAEGLAFQPMTAITYLFARIEQGDGEGLSSREQQQLRDLRRRFGEVFELDPDAAEVMLFRLSSAEAPSVRSLRRPLEDILTISR